MSDINFIIKGAELYTEKILAEFECPLLFICKDKSNKRYSVLCVDSEEERYLVIRSKASDIVDMIQNTITMKELFLNAKNGVVWIITAGNSPAADVIETLSIQDVQDVDLPNDGAFYEVYNSDVHDYVNMLKKDCNCK